MPEPTVHATLGAHGGQPRVFLKTPFRLKDAAKGLPNARWDGQRWHIPASASAVLSMHTRMRGEEIAMDAGVSTLYAEGQHAIKAQENRTAEALPEIPGKYCQCEESYRIEDRDLSCAACGLSFGSMLHQRQAYWFIINGELKYAMLGMDMGTGKSKVAVSLVEKWEARRILIVCPKNVMGVWPREFKLHSSYEGWRYIVPSEKGSVQKRSLWMGQQAHMAGDRPYIVIVNYDACWRTQMTPFLMSIEWDLIVLDESHRVKAPGGKTSKFLTRLSTHAARRLTLTGTPMPHSPLDIYAQYRFLDPGVFGTSFNRFRNRYAIMGGYEDRQVMDYQNEDELSKKWGAIAYICKSEDVLDLPGWLPIERTFELDTKTRKAYGVIENDFILGVNNGTVTATNALTKLLRLQQITSGYVRDDEGIDHRIGDEKASLLADVLEDFATTEPIVIFARFKHDIAVIREVCEKQGRRVGELSGAERSALTSEAKMRDDIDVAIVQLKSGGVGIDLTRAAYAIYYSMDHSLGDFDQSKKRLDRPGQRRPVRFIFLIGNNTKDPVVLDALRTRKNVVESFIESARRPEG